MSLTSRINKAMELLVWGIESVFYAKDKLTIARKIQIISVSGTLKNIPEQENLKAHSQTDILLTLKNTSAQEIIIGKILIDYHEKGLKPIYEYEAEAGMKKLITPLKSSIAEGGKRKEIHLRYINNALTHEQKQQKELRAVLRLYSNEHRLLKKIPLAIHSSSKDL